MPGQSHVSVVVSIGDACSRLSAMLPVRSAMVREPVGEIVRRPRRR